MKIYHALIATATTSSFALLSAASAVAQSIQGIQCQGGCPPPVSVPEPSTLAVLGAAVVGLAALRRSMKK
jgi:hypothetical protein